MQLYLYSCQDLNIQGNAFTIKAGDFYRLEMDNNDILLYPSTSSGVMILNARVLNARRHNQITFHELNSSAVLCEIKPFVFNERAKQYLIKDANVKVVENLDNIYLYFKGEYYGCINQKCKDIVFEKIEKNDNEYGILKFIGNAKYILLFNHKQVIFCGQYVDSEILKDCIQIYSHVGNMFNVGSLLNYNFETDEIHTKTICDRGEERKQFSSEFNIIYFLEAIKCRRFKYAYNKLSYELRSAININVLSQYFTPFDKYFYLSEQNVYITLTNNKVAGVYRFDLKDNLINNIY